MYPKIKTEISRAWGDGFFKGFLAGTMVISALWSFLAYISEYLQG